MWREIVAVAFATSSITGAHALRCPATSTVDYAGMALDGDCSASYRVGPSMAVLLGCDIVMDPGAKNETPKVDPPNFSCKDDGGAESFIQLRRKITSSIEDGKGKVSMFASDTATLESNNMEDPASTLATCSRNGPVRCMPGPCSVLGMSFFQDPNSKYDVSRHGTLLSPKTDTSASRNFVAEKGVTAVYGYGQCDPMAGSRLMQYNGSISDFVTVDTAVDTSEESKAAMQRLAAEIRSDTSAFGSETGRELWPDTLPVPPLFQVNEKEANPVYMYCKGGDINANNQECQDLRTYMEPNNTAKILPPPMYWQCTDGKKPPPILWVLPDPQSGRFKLTATASLLEVKGELVKAGKARLNTILGGNTYTDDLAAEIDANFYYTYEGYNSGKTQLPTGIHPRKVRCRGSSSVNPHDPSVPGSDGFLEITNCESDLQNGHLRFFFGSMARSYDSPYTPILVYPQLPNLSGEGSVPGAFSANPQIVGYVFTPQILNILVQDIEGDGNATDARNQRVEQAIQNIVQLSAQTYIYDSVAENTDALVYTPDTCHIFSDDAPLSGGCHWLPRHVPPAICPDARASKPQDTFIPASSSRMTQYGAGFGLLNFGEYACTNFHVSLQTGDYSDDDDSMVLQHRGPIECMRARTNDQAEVLAYDIVDRGLVGKNQGDYYSKIRNFRTVANFAFRMSEPRSNDIRFSMKGSAYSPYAINVTIGDDDMSLRVTTDTFIKTDASLYDETAMFVLREPADPPELHQFIDENCRGVYKQMGGKPFIFGEGEGYNGDWWSSKQNSTRRFCNWTGLITDTSSTKQHRRNPRLWMSSENMENRFVKSFTDSAYPYKLCPLSMCQTSKYGDYQASTPGWFYPWAFLNNDVHHETTYLEASCSCCTFSHTRMYWYEAFTSSTTRYGMNTDQDWKCYNQAGGGDYKDYKPYMNYQLNFLPPGIRNNIYNPGKGNLYDNDRKNQFGCNCADQWNGRYTTRTGYIFSDLFYGDDSGTIDLKIAHSFAAWKGTVMTRDKTIGLGFPGRMDDKSEYGSNAPIGVRWHYNYSAFRPGFSFSDDTPLDKAVEVEGYGVGSEKIQMVSTTTCGKNDPGCQQIEDDGIDPDIVLGQNGSKTAFRGKLLFTKEILHQNSAIKTNLVVNTKYQRTYPELHPFNGYSFARTRAWTSSVAPGRACSCRNRTPEYRCFDTLLTDTKNPLIMRGDTIDNLKAYIRSNFSSLGNTAAYEEEVLSSLVLATCGFFWKGDNNNLVFGLPMYGQTDDKFYIYQHNVYNGDYYTSKNLAGVTAANTSTTDVRRELQQLIFTNPVDPASLVNYEDGGGVWEMPSTCLRWPYGSAHVQSFSEEEAQRLVRDTTKVVKKVPGSNNVVVTRVFDSDVQLGYCDLVNFSTGGNSAPEKAMVACENDPNTAQQRVQFCKDNPHAGDRFGGLRIDNPDPRTMCNDAVCLFVPGHRSVPTLRDFFRDSRLNLANKTVLVAPFNTSTVEYGLFFDFLVNNKVIPDADEDDNGVSFIDRRAFVMFAAMPPDFTPDDVRETTKAFVGKMCPEGRAGLCRRNAVPGGGAPTSMIEPNALSKDVLPPLDTTDIRISQPGVAVESAYDYIWFSGEEKHATTHTRFNVGARDVHIGPIVADQQGCQSGFNCAAVVFSGVDVGGSSTESIEAQNTDVAVMALGLDTAAFGRVGKDLEADGLRVGVVVTEGQQYAFAAAAANGNMTVDCGKSDRRCGAMVQPMARDSMSVTSPDEGFFLFDLSKATGLFGDAEERRVFALPPDQTATLVAVFTTIVVAAALTLAAHVALFAKNRSFCTWLVEHSIAGKNLERQPSTEAAYPWCVRWSPSTRKYMVFASDGASKKLAPLAPLSEVIVRVVTGVDGGCEPFVRHIGLVEYAKECLV